MQSSPPGREGASRCKWHRSEEAEGEETGKQMVTPSKKRSDKGAKDRETECHKQKQRRKNTEPNKRQKKTKSNRVREAETQRN